MYTIYTMFCRCADGKFSNDQPRTVATRNLFDIVVPLFRGRKSMEPLHLHIGA